MDRIIIRGARQHNLKNIDLDLPRRRLIVITGVSGSGKSSLAFDTLYAEGQRRYMEALSTYARKFLHRLDAPDVDEIEGLSPAIAIEQNVTPRNPRSTVGTLTEIHDYLRILFARLGTLICPRCGIPIRAYTINRMLEEMEADWPQGSRVLVLAPLGSLREKDLPGILKRLRRDGFARVRVEGKIYELEPLPRFPRRPAHRLEVVVDRLILERTKEQRWRESLELASRLGKGDLTVFRLEGGEKQFTESFRCVSCGIEMSEPSPALFSFHHPSGACNFCNGLGVADGVEAVESTSENEAESSEEGSISGEDDLSSPLFMEAPTWNRDVRIYSPQVCPVCQGSRLNEIARAVRFGGLNLAEVSQLSIPRFRDWIGNVHLSPREMQIADRPIREILHRLDVMVELGLSYLFMGRSAGTLSGGEAQRIRLAHQISSPLSGVLYVLDEPSVGLHPHDHGRLLNVLFKLRDHGNTVVVVEHDRETIVKSDYVVDMGPGAGVHGGEVLFSGLPAEMMHDARSPTGAYLSGRKGLGVFSRRTPFEKGVLRVTGARGHNLKNISVSFPLGCTTCVTGVSGSGKTTLVLHTLYRALAHRMYAARAAFAPFDDLMGSELIGRIVLVDQAPIGKSSRSNPATSSGVFSLIRMLFSQIPEAKARGYGAGRFSFNVKGGRCEACKGEGIERLEMLFLPDVHVRCPVCLGTRYGSDTLQIRFKGRSVAEVLDMTIQEARGFFHNVPAIGKRLAVFEEVGLGYLKLGQGAPTLSGGEAQRIKLAGELSRRVSVKTLYVLDEPTTGLHFEDIGKLLHVLQRLVDEGHTVIMIEHHPEVIRSADYVIDLGPEGGEKGGFVVASGSPEAVAQVEGSSTGKYLREALERNKGR